ncbi:MAG: PQQ-dependent dehydrogenase, methanol/ethanol family [Novosphingobium sp.]|nr:PQQ-dependent dehydrogenase, methanol/ethanol family [Novosphingobium sp.]
MVLIAAAVAIAAIVGGTAVYSAGASGEVDWPGHGNGPDETGYSPLAQIDTNNVARLGLAWSLDLPGEVTLEATPIEVGGTLYFTGSNADVYAVDAHSGHLRWKHDAEVWKNHPEKLQAIFPINRGCAYADGRIFSATTDGRLQALDAHSGKLLWSAQTLDPASPENITGAPRVFDGKVIIGQGGADFGKRGYVTAYDQATGHQAWRFYVAPGSPEQNQGDPAMERAAATWRGEWWKTGTGGGPWDSITFDPELDRVYVGTGNAAPYDPKLRQEGDNLYTASIVALDAKTGKYLWHYQVNPGDSWDFDSTQQITLATLTVDGKPCRVLMQAPKNGFFYVIDRDSGKLLSAGKLGKVTWADRIDLATGRPVEVPGARYESGEAVLWPSMSGMHSWMSMAFSPRTGLVYLPVMQLGMRYTRLPGTYTGTDGKPFYGGPGDGKGTLLAWDPVAQEPRWRVEHDLIWNGGVLATGGNLVFQGAADGWFSAYDAATGAPLWRFNAGLGIISQPISYRLEGTQYVALLVGYGSPNRENIPTMNPGWKFDAQPRRLLVFKLGGTAKLPATAPPSHAVAALDDPKLVLDPARVKAGQALYAYCSVCHGGDVVSSGTAPDLRESGIAFDPQSLYQVVHDGPLVRRGMPPFSQLTRDQVNLIYTYIRDRARAAKAAGAR